MSLVLVALQKYGAAAKLLCTKVIAMCRELASKEWGIVLVREHKVARFKLVEFEDSILDLDDSRTGAGSKFLLANPAGSTFGMIHSCGPHLDTQGPK